MSDHRGDPDDPYSRTHYRRLFAWDRRLEREAPFLTRLLEAGPASSVLDIGCGTGEHVAFFRRLGARVVGLDRSESMIAAARDHETDGVTFVLGDALHARRELAEASAFGLIICLGNMLPHILEDHELDAHVVL